MFHMYTYIYYFWFMFQQHFSYVFGMIFLGFEFLQIFRNQTMGRITFEREQFMKFLTMFAEQRWISAPIVQHFNQLVRSIV